MGFRQISTVWSPHHLTLSNELISSYRTTIADRTLAISRANSHNFIMILLKKSSLKSSKNCRLDFELRYSPAFFIPGRTGALRVPCAEISNSSTIRLTTGRLNLAQNRHGLLIMKVEVWNARYSVAWPALSSTVNAVRIVSTSHGKILQSATALATHHRVCKPTAASNLIDCWSCYRVSPECRSETHSKDGRFEMISDKKLIVKRSKSVTFESSPNRRSNELLLRTN